MREGKTFRFEGLIVASVVFFALLLAVMTVNSLKLLSDTRAYLQADMDKRLLQLAEDLGPELKERYGRLPGDPYYLYSISVRESLYRLALIGRDGGVLLDSSGGGDPKPGAARMGITPEQLSEVWQGGVELSELYRRKGAAVKSVYFPVYANGGRITSVCEASLDAAFIEELSQQGTTYFFIKSLVTVFILTVILYFVRSLVASQKKLVSIAKGTGLAGAQGSDNVSFVIDTFHTMAKQFKEKERELNELKKLAEKKAKYIESYNENILRSIQSGVISTDRDGKVITANQASEAMLRTGPEGLAGKGIEEVLGRDSWLAALTKKTLSEARPLSRAEGELSVPGKASRWLGASTSPLLDEAGRLEGCILVFTDLTEVRELKERAELKERLTVLGEMSAGIAHELRNPMGVIKGYAEFLSRKLSDDAASVEAIASIEEEIKVMDEIISEFMNFTQPTELNITEVEVGPLLEESLKALSGTGADVARRLDVGGPLPVVEGDPVLLRQAFVNVMKNALDAMPGGGSLTVTARAIEASGDEGASLPGERYVKVEVADTGSGIEKEDLSRIFTPFFTTKQSGTGLGLALVQKILVYHGGRATVKSKPGQGTTFCAYLPAKTPPGPAKGI